MGSLFKPKMPPLPPVQPLPEPPSSELSRKKKKMTGLQQSKAAMERKRKGRRSTILTGPLGVEEEAETEQKTLLGS
jgi:hypothetical protein